MDTGQPMYSGEEFLEAADDDDDDFAAAFSFSEVSEGKSEGSLESEGWSLGSSVFDYLYLNGRRYQNFHDGFTLLPNDELEQDRLDIYHHLQLMILDNQLHLAPIASEGYKVKRILDLGTGTGIWAIDMADKYPDVEIVGVDLSPMQPSWVPPNLRFEIDDIENPWTFSRNFDFIHIRGLAGSILDWPKLLRQAYRFLKPGGYIEVAESDFQLDCDDDDITPLQDTLASNPDPSPSSTHALTAETPLSASSPFPATKNSSLSAISATCTEASSSPTISTIDTEASSSSSKLPESEHIPGSEHSHPNPATSRKSRRRIVAEGSFSRRYVDLLIEASQLAGRELPIVLKMKELLESAGFIDVKRTTKKLPWGAWARDKKFRELGAWTMLVLESGLEAYAMQLLTRTTNMTPKDVTDLVEGVKNELRQRKNHVYTREHILYARKPFRNPAPPSQSGKKYNPDRPDPPDPPIKQEPKEDEDGLSAEDPENAPEDLLQSGLHRIGDGESMFSERSRWSTEGKRSAEAVQGREEGENNLARERC